MCRTWLAYVRIILLLSRVLVLKWNLPGSDKNTVVYTRIALLQLQTPNIMQKLLSKGSAEGPYTGKNGRGVRAWTQVITQQGHCKNDTIAGSTKEFVQGWKHGERKQVPYKGLANFS